MENTQKTQKWAIRRSDLFLYFAYPDRTTNQILTEYHLKERASAALGIND